MATTAKATAYLDLNIAGFDQAIKTAKNLMVAFAAGFSAYKIADFFTDGVKGAIDFGKEMQSASRAMGGFDPGALLLTQKALEKAGMGAQEAQGHIGDFIREGRNISEIFGGSENYAKALKSAAQDYGSQADVLSRSGEKLQSVWNTMESIGSKVRTFFLTMTEQFVYPLQAALDYLKQIDLAGVGTSFGKAISDAATILLGVFKNGNIFEVMKLGLTVAFQEGVNWLVGGINYVSGITGPMLGKAFVAAMEFLSKAWDFLFSGDQFASIGDGFLGIAAQFTAKMLEGINSLISFLQTGIQYAIQSAIEAIPGASEVLGIGGATHESFDEMAKANKGPIPQEFIDSVRGSGKGLTDNAGVTFKDFASGLFAGKSEKGFQKGNVFDTADDSKKLQDAIAKGFQTGTQMIAESREKHAGDETGAKKVLTSFSGSSSKVIADSLAKVGGGGGFLRAGMSLQERTQLQQLMAQKQGNAALAIIQKNTEPTRRTQPLGR